MNSDDLKLLDSQLRTFLSNETDPLANTSNFVGLLYNALDDINWLGVYVLRADNLVLGPYQGKPACVRIEMGSGVCGTAAATLSTQRIADVQTFDGHIACDPDSRSELVVPLMIGGDLVGVLDIDSPTADRFQAADQRAVESLCATFCEFLSQQQTFI